MGVLKQIEEYSYSDYIKWEGDWEIISGNAYAMSPSPGRKHQNTASKISGELYGFLKGKPCKSFFEFDVVLSEKDVVRPDIIVVCDKNKITEENVKGAPDFIVEVLSPSSAKRDRILKVELYKKHGVKEYWIADPFNCCIEVYNFEKDEHKLYFMGDGEIAVGIFGEELKMDIDYLFSDE